MDMQIYRRDKECVEEEQFQYKTGSCNLSVIAFILVVTVVAINIQYVLFSVCTWVNSHYELPTFL